jgi:hypothetical protein
LNVKHLLWLIERMVDMRVADNAVKLWSEQVALAADLQKLLTDADMWRNMAPGLPMLVTRCTLRLANSVVTGETLVSRQVSLQDDTLHISVSILLVLVLLKYAMLISVIGQMMTSSELPT